MLVALTIMAMIAGLLTNSMSFSLNTAETVEARILELESFHQAQRAFRRQVQLAMPVASVRGEEQQPLEFSASANQLDFVAPLPGLAAGGTLYRIALHIEDDRNFDEQGGRLIMSYSLYLDTAWHQGQEPDVRQVVLMDGFSRADFSYLGTIGTNKGTWLDNWHFPDRLPDLVRLSIKSDSNATDESMDLIVAIKTPLPVRQEGV